MGVLLPFLALPFAVAAMLLLMMGGHWAHKSSEQVRLDALTLSVCHHRKNFIQSEILPLNRDLKTLQHSMDAVALPCFEALLATGPLGAVTVCKGVKIALRKLSNTSTQLQNYQDIKRAEYFSVQKNLKMRLSRENQLNEQYGELRFLLPLTDGWSREQISTVRAPMEAYFGVQWPRILKTDPSFSFQNEFRSDFYPKRFLSTTRKNPVELKNAPTSASGKAASHSGCKILRRSESEFIVRRFL